MNKLSIVILILGVGYFYLRWYLQGGECGETHDLKGRVALVTGANTGIGKETAIGLAKMGAKVIIACRDKARGSEALADIKRISNNNNVELMLVDLADLASVRSFVTEYKKKELPLHILVANAGLGMIMNRAETKNGFELNMGVNHLGHFLLVSSLLDVVKSSASEQNPARIVVVSSDMHKLATLELDNLNLDKPNSYGFNAGYCNSKLANVMFVTELQKRLNADGYAGKIAAFAVHPGFVASDFGRNVPDLFKSAFAMLTTSLAKNNHRGAQPSICLAISPRLAEIGAGKYFNDWITVASTHPMATDTVATARLWELSEKLTAA